MSHKNKEIIRKENVTQAIVVADCFADEFVPITNDTSLALLPLVNKPLIDYTLEFLSLGGIDETFLFCCFHIDAVKTYIQKCISEAVGWSLTMKVNIISSNSCSSFGDCIRDLDAKGLLTGDFVLLEPGVLSNINLLPLIKNHSAVAKTDKGAAMTLIFQEVGRNHLSLSPCEETILAMTDKNRIVFYKKVGKTKEKKIQFPVELFLENNCITLLHNVKDTHIAICSQSVLPLFADNYDFQTKDDFVRGLLMNEDILGSTLYCQVLKGSEYGGAVTSWRMYQAISQELQNRWIFPLVPSLKRNKILRNKVVSGKNTKLSSIDNFSNIVIGENVTIGKNVSIKDSFIFDSCTIEDNVVITHSVIGANCVIKINSKVTAGCILGNDVVIEEGSFIENTLVQSTQPEFSEDGDKIGEKAYRIRIDEDEEDIENDKQLAKQLSRLHITDHFSETDDDENSEDEFSESVENLSYTNSPVPDDTKLFLNEVIDSLTSGFEDSLLCDNLILEINASRYAYNVTVKEVNFNVVKAILIMSLKQPIGSQFFSHLSRLLTYFGPILTNYLRNESAMIDALQAVEDVAISHENVTDKWTMFVLKFLYDKDYITEDAILDWFGDINDTTKFHKHVKPFTDWLKDAEEASSSDEDED